MLIWSLHPKYLDTKGLVAQWREAIIAKNALEGTSEGFQNHPQVDRFKQHSDPVSAINKYLSGIYDESKRRDYNFNKDYIGSYEKNVSMNVSEEKLKKEWSYLKSKLEERDFERYQRLKSKKDIKAHPLFEIVE